MSGQVEMFRRSQNARTGIASDVPILSRSTDPESSRAAARKLVRSGRLSKQRRMILEILADSEGPLSAADLTTAFGLTREDYYRACRRLPELRAMGYAEALDALPAQRWRITRAGLEALADRSGR